MKIEMRNVINMRRRMSGRLPIDHDVIDDRLGPLCWHRQKIGKIRGGALSRFWQSIKHARRKSHADRRQFTIGVRAHHSVRFAVANTYRLALVGRRFALGQGWPYREQGNARCKNEEWAQPSPPATPNHDCPPSKLTRLRALCQDDPIFSLAFAQNNVEPNKLLPALANGCCLPPPKH